MEYVVIGKIINIRGLKGELKVKNYSDFAKQRYKKGSKVIFLNENNGQSKEFVIKEHHEVAPFDFIMVEGIDSVDVANLYRDWIIQVPTEELPSLDSDSYYFYQLENCQVFDEQHQLIGTVSQIEGNPAQNYLRIKTYNKDVLVPFVKAFIKKVDIEKKEITIQKMEGLL